MFLYGGNLNPTLIYHQKLSLPGAFSFVYKMLLHLALDLSSTMQERHKGINVFCMFTNLNKLNMPFSP